jgi:murein L,D-transpeptidase YcbB/YkuD
MKSKHIFLVLITVISTFLIQSCSQKTVPYSYHQSPSDTEAQEQEPLVDTPQEEERLIDLDRARVVTKSMVLNLEENALNKVDGEWIFTSNTIKEIYRENNYQLTWHDEKNRHDALLVLESSWQDGLTPNDYHLDVILKLRDDILDDAEIPYDKIAKIDLYLTDGLVFYMYHLLRGKLSPNSLNPNWNLHAKDLPAHPADLILKAIKNQEVVQMANKLRPQNEVYSRFVNGLKKYQEYPENGGWEKVNFESVIKPGESDKNMVALRKRLEITLDLIFNDNPESHVYDEELVDAVKKYQIRHGLNPDGVIGKGTLAALNIPIEKKLDMIRINMERARWILADISDDMILVNIANFKLFYLNDSTRVHESKVMVGTTFHQTPIFKSKLQYIVFNPTWTVPYSIASKEMLPRLKSDPNYLVDRNMVLLNRSGKQVAQSSVDWSKISINNFPYTVRQEPGSGNALGRVKFIFPNKHSVYLHDTPSKYLFVKEERAFSHGCIRVENPLKLAEILLDNKNKYAATDIDNIIKSKKLTQVNLKKPIDVLLMYWTCGFTEDLDMFFVPDVYSRDEKISSGLSNTNWEELFKDYDRVEQSSAKTLNN